MAACGGDSSTTDGGSDGSANNDGTVGNDGSAGDGGSEAAPPKQYTGSVNLSETAGGNINVFSASAAFEDTPDSGTSSSGCLGTQSGSCCYVPPGTDAGTPPTPVFVGAGAITIKDGTTSIGTMTPTGTTYTAITNPPTTALTWAAGDTLAISGAGDTVHAFSGSVDAVAEFAAVSPALSQVVPTTINRSADFTITWTAKTGSISLTLAATKGLTTPDGTITCTASSDTGTITVPHALLGNFTAADGGQILLGRTASGDASVDNASITIFSSTGANGKATFN